MYTNLTLRLLLAFAKCPGELVDVRSTNLAPRLPLALDKVRERPRTRFTLRFRLAFTKLLSAYQLAFFTPGISPL